MLQSISKQAPLGDTTRGKMFRDTSVTELTIARSNVSANVDVQSQWRAESISWNLFLPDPDDAELKLA
jgi:hypothetical protein